MKTPHKAGFSVFGGEKEIRTLEGLLTLAGFQDRCIKPLCHLSAIGRILRSCRHLVKPFFVLLRSFAQLLFNRFYFRHHSNFDYHFGKSALTAALCLRTIEQNPKSTLS